MLEFVKTYQGEDRASFDYYVEGSHDIYVTVDKRIISVPRHPGDLTPGVKRSIKKALRL